ncbi:hypothetical protein BDZ89DRAFT_1234672 [Hymenopellis radicata]|nr:hypothetical protein BDZ89DRAFT_1234672 [Hymenopellis radicata]
MEIQVLVLSRLSTVPLPSAYGLVVRGFATCQPYSVWKVLKAKDELAPGELLKFAFLVNALSLAPWPRLEELVQISTFTICLPADGALHGTSCEALRFLPPGTLQTLSITNLPPIILPIRSRSQRGSSLSPLSPSGITFFNGGRFDANCPSYVAFWNRNNLFLNLPNIRTLSIRSDTPVFSGESGASFGVQFPHLESLDLEGSFWGISPRNGSSFPRENPYISKTRKLSHPLARAPEWGAGDTSPQ